MKQNRRFVLFSLIAVLLSTTAFSQTATVTDTSKVPAMYVTDSVFFHTTTGWVQKITTYGYQFVPVQQPTDKTDSFTVKKQKVLAKDPEYYLKSSTGKFEHVKVLFEFKP